MKKKEKEKLCSLYIQIWNKIYVKYLITKKAYKQKYFSVITKNSDLEILAKNLVTFKRKNGVKDEKL